MNKCTEGWPNAPSDVSPDAVEAFLAHVARCPLHQKAQDAEEEKIHSRFRLARGLDPHGRILRGSELDRAVKAHDRNHAAWKQIAKEMNRPFKRIYLSNRGDLVAGSGKFFIFRKYEGNHRLEPEAGLQLWGVIAEGKSIPDVQLGFYPLAGVRHTGQEQFLPFANDYTVGLRVEQLSDDEFNIGFRCIGNEILERERATATVNNEQTAPVDPPTPLRRITAMLRRVVPSWRWTTARLRRFAWSFRSEPLSFKEKVVSCVVVVLAFSIAWFWLDPGPQIKAKNISATSESKNQDSSTNANSKTTNLRQARQIPRKKVKSKKRNSTGQTESSAVGR
ncbi:MAG TPA: hypothetical protein VFP64_14975 [Pyrinomonadaceae bacterium]|nr:hypothetical protein [Pyrinomonadaceae bacterium]